MTFIGGKLAIDLTIARLYEGVSSLSHAIPSPPSSPMGPLTVYEVAR